MFQCCGPSSDIEIDDLKDTIKNVCSYFKVFFVKSHKFYNLLKSLFVIDVLLLHIFLNVIFYFLMFYLLFLIVVNLTEYRDLLVT